jgi:CO/xanthine dehydrogenase Mo-binding subunit
MEKISRRQTGQPLTTGYFRARVMTHLDAPGIVPSMASGASATFNATGKQIKHLPITRQKLLEALA